MSNPEARKPEWEHNTPINFWELSLPEQLVYSSAYGAEFQSSHNKRDYAVAIAKNALYSFWRRHGNPRFHISLSTMSLADDDWGY